MPIVEVSDLPLQAQTYGSDCDRIYVNIYIERERGICVYGYDYIHICVYVYIYIEREICICWHCVACCVASVDTYIYIHTDASVLYPSRQNSLDYPSNEEW